MLRHRALTVRHVWTRSSATLAFVQLDILARLAQTFSTYAIDLDISFFITMFLIFKNKNFSNFLIICFNNYSCIDLIFFLINYRYDFCLRTAFRPHALTVEAA